MKFHRNSQKRFYDSGNIYFITTNTFNRFPFFKEEIFCDLFIENLKLCKELKKFRLYGFSIEYNHVHLLLQPSDEYNISEIMRSLKTNFSRDAHYIIKTEGEVAPLRFQNKQTLVRLQGKIKEYISQHQKYINFLHNKFLQKYENNHNLPSFRWQLSFYDHIIRNERDFGNHWNYTSYNYIKHNINENWKYCTENFWEMIDELG